MKIQYKITIMLLMITLALVSIVKITPITTSEENHKHSLEQIDDKIAAALKLTGGATAVSAAISLLPDDQCTPISEQIAELAKYFLAVVSMLYLEKYLVTLMGYVSFTVLLPVGLILLGIGISLGKNHFKSIACKLIICAALIYAIIPTSVKVSDMVYRNHVATVEDTISMTDSISIQNEDAEGIAKFTSWITNAAGTIVDYVTGFLSKFVDALAVMIVTACFIPILVIVLYVAIIKILFGKDVFHMVVPSKVL